MDLQKAYDNRKIISENKISLIRLRMTDGYGIATNYLCKNECPYCKSEIVKTGMFHGCYDGEWTQVDEFTCKNKCLIQYRDMRKQV